MKISILALALTVLCVKSRAPEPAKAEKWNQNPVIAHRGAWKKNHLPENSIASLKEAVRIGCHGSEFDVHMTADSVLVINHDAEFMGMPIPASTYQELLTKKTPQS